MNANANIVDQVEGKSTLVRPRFSPGLLLRDDDLTVGVDYTRELSRLLFQSLFGCGVVCGLEVSTAMECGKLKVTVDRGVALNAMGDPIHVPKSEELKVDPTCGKEIPAQLWVILCRTEKCCAPRSAVCGCEEEDSPTVCTREQEGFEIRLEEGPLGDCVCKCSEIDIPERPQMPDNQQETKTEPEQCWCAKPCGCLKDHYAGKCACKCCEPNCVVLAVLSDTTRDPRYKDSQVGKEAQAAGNQWIENHSVRRFIRPMLMRDPVAFKEQTYVEDPCPKQEDQQQAAGKQQSAASTAGARSKNK